MITLPVIKPRYYISPSAFATWRNCQSQFYLFYLAGYPYIKRKSSYVATLGNVFDACTKGYVAKKRGVSRIDGEKLIKKAFEQASDDFDWGECERRGREVAEQFIKANGCLDYLEATELDIDREIYSNNYQGVPILGIFDFILNGVPDDLKTRGFGVSRTSPYKGYTTRFNHEGNRLPPHKEYVQNLEDKNEDWARQMLFYNWLLGRTNLRYKIRELVDDKKGGWISVVHEGNIGSEFAAKTLSEIQVMYGNICRLDCEIEEPDPNKWRCEKYGQLCMVVKYCTAYETTLGSIEARRATGAL